MEPIFVCPYTEQEADILYSDAGNLYLHTHTDLQKEQNLGVLRQCYLANVLTRKPEIASKHV